MTMVFILALIVAAPLACLLFLISGAKSQQNRDRESGLAAICGFLMMMLALTMAFGLGLAMVQP